MATLIRIPPPEDIRLKAFHNQRRTPPVESGGVFVCAIGRVQSGLYVLSFSDGICNDVVAPSGIDRFCMVPVGHCGINAGRCRERAQSFAKRSKGREPGAIYFSTLGPVERSETNRSGGLSLGNDDCWVTSRRDCSDNSCFDRARLAAYSRKGRRRTSWRQRFHHQSRRAGRLKQNEC